MRTSGMIEYITPLQGATESSTTPKSVINTIVGGYFCACPTENPASRAMTANTARTLRLFTIIFTRIGFIPGTGLRRSLLEGRSLCDVPPGDVPPGGLCHPCATVEERRFSTGLSVRRVGVQPLGAAFPSADL